MLESVRKLMAAAGFGDHNSYMTRADREDAIHNPERHFLCVALDDLALCSVFVRFAVRLHDEMRAVVRIASTCLRVNGCAACTG